MHPSSRFVPSLLLGEVYPLDQRQPNDVRDGLEAAIAGGYFRRCEIPVPKEQEACDVVRTIVDGHPMRLTCWASEELSRLNLNLADCDERNRERAVAGVIAMMERARTCGADCLGILSGPDPGLLQRKEASRSLFKSLTQLGRAAHEGIPVKIVLEPLDREAHKRGLIGPSDEAFELMRCLRSETQAVYLGWDSGHVMLNGEDPAESLADAAPYVWQIHLSNPVVDRLDPMFGDHHYPIGERGVGTVEQFESILNVARRCDFPQGDQTSVAIEVRTQGGLTALANTQACERLLRSLLHANVRETSST